LRPTQGYLLSWSQIKKKWWSAEEHKKKGSRRKGLRRRKMGKRNSFIIILEGKKTSVSLFEAAERRMRRKEGKGLSQGEGRSGLRRAKRSVLRKRRLKDHSSLLSKKFLHDKLKSNF